MESLAKDTRSSVLNHIKAVMTVRLAQNKTKKKKGAKQVTVGPPRKMLHKKRLWLSRRQISV